MNTTDLLSSALQLHPMPYWTARLKLARTTLHTAQYRGHLSPAVAGALAEELGKDAETWMLIAALESEKDSACKQRMLKRFQRLERAEKAAKEDDADEWKSWIKRLGGAAASILLAAGLGGMSNADANLAQTSKVNNIYIVLNKIHPKSPAASFSRCAQGIGYQFCGVRTTATEGKVNSGKTKLIF